MVCIVKASLQNRHTCVLTVTGNRTPQIIYTIIVYRIQDSVLSLPVLVTSFAGNLPESASLWFGNGIRAVGVGGNSEMKNTNCAAVWYNMYTYVSMCNTWTN